MKTNFWTPVFCFGGGAIYISSKFPGDTDVAGLKTIRCEQLAE